MANRTQPLRAQYERLFPAALLEHIPSTGTADSHWLNSARGRQPGIDDLTAHVRLRSDTQDLLVVGVDHRDGDLEIKVLPYGPRSVRSGIMTGFPGLHAFEQYCRDRNLRFVRDEAFEPIKIAEYNAKLTAERDPM